MRIVLNMYKENSLNTLPCQNRGNTAMGHKILLQADMKVTNELDKYLDAKLRTPLQQLYNRNNYRSVEQKQTIFISSGLKDTAIKATKDEHIDFSKLRIEANTRMLHASVVATCPNTEAEQTGLLPDQNHSDKISRENA